MISVSDRGSAVEMVVGVAVVSGEGEARSPHLDPSQTRPPARHATWSSCCLPAADFSATCNSQADSKSTATIEREHQSCACLVMWGAPGPSADFHHHGACHLVAPRKVVAIQGHRAETDQIQDWNCRMSVLMRNRHRELALPLLVDQDSSET